MVGTVNGPEIDVGVGPPVPRAGAGQSLSDGEDDGTEGGGGLTDVGNGIGVSDPLGWAVTAAASSGLPLEPTRASETTAPNRAIRSLTIDSTF